MFSNARASPRRMSCISSSSASEGKSAATSVSAHAAAGWITGRGARRLRAPPSGSCLVDRDRVDVGVARGARGDLGVLVLRAGLGAGLAEAEAGRLEHADGVEDLVEARRAGGRQALDLFALRELRVDAVVAELAQRLQRQRAVDRLRGHDLRGVAGE